MLGSCNAMAFVATRDAANARQFYEAVLGLRFVADEPYALVFDLNGTMLRVQKVEDLTPPPYTTLGWSVPSIAEAVTGLEGRGVTFERYPFMAPDGPPVWTPPGSTAKLAWFKDPDGNTLSLTEMA